MNKISFAGLSMIAVLSVFLSARAEDKHESPQVSLCGTSGYCLPARRESFVLLVLEEGALYWDKKPIPNAEVISYVNGLLKAKKVSIVGVYAREGSKFGDVVRAVDLLRGTNAEHIGVSISEIPYDREP